MYPALFVGQLALLAVLTTFFSNVKTKPLAFLPTSNQCPKPRKISKVETRSRPRADRQYPSSVKNRMAQCFGPTHFVVKMQN